MSHKCEHGKDSDICVQCWEEKKLESQEPLPEDLRKLQADAQHAIDSAEAKEYEANAILQIFNDVKPSPDAESYLRIWSNCLGNMIYPKHHWIDALGKTTRLLNADKVRFQEQSASLQKQLEEVTASHKQVSEQWKSASDKVLQLVDTNAKLESRLKEVEIGGRK